jgi:hypothetical protein
MSRRRHSESETSFGLGRKNRVSSEADFGDSVK